MVDADPAPGFKILVRENFSDVTCSLVIHHDANKQASIIDPDAGTYLQLVEAAESCQVSIIHPGKPRNPNEPD